MYLAKQRFPFQNCRRMAIAAEKIQYHGPLKTKRRGVDILHDPIWNKDLAFEVEERDRLGIRGLLPAKIETIEIQLARSLRELFAEPDDVHKNIMLQELQNRNETLFHRLLADNLEEIAPLVYTPTIAKVCQQYGFRFTRARGMFLPITAEGSLSTMVHNWPFDDVHNIVVTDGSRILGLGDLGAHGMGIPIGKLALYCTAGGVAPHPHRVLPILLDVGTNNETLLSSVDYLGLKQQRVYGEEYFEFLDEFMSAVFARWPDVCVQFEDFETSKAFPLLERYRYCYRCFNDDIQGTGCVTLAGLFTASKIAEIPFNEHRILCAGTGSGGLGVCGEIVSFVQKNGMSLEEARSKFVVFSSKGAIGKQDGKYGDPNYKGKFNENRMQWANQNFSDGMPMDLLIAKFKPTLLLGLTGHGGTLKESMIREMAKHVAKPIIVPMSNPISNSECTAEQAYTWTDGRAIVMTGSPFSPVTLEDGRTLIPSQSNNMYTFPGCGLAASIGGLKIITDEMLIAAAKAVSENVTKEELNEGRTFPKISRIRSVSHAVACAMIRTGWEQGLTKKIKESDIQEEGLEAFVDRKMYYPYYLPLL